MKNKFSEYEEKSFCLVEACVKFLKTNEIFISLQDEAVAVAGDGEDDGETNSSQLDPKNLKVAELRAELEARNLPSKGKAVR